MGKDIVLTVDARKELLRAIDTLDSLLNWDDAEFVRKFGKTKNTARKAAMMKIREILHN
jgi:NurA-like 5'-3' nuclease